MKFSNLMLFTGAAWSSYHWSKIGRQLTKKSSKHPISWIKIQDNLANIQHNLAIIQEQRDNIKEMAQDLTYKYKVFEKQAQAQITQIQDIWQ